MKDKMPRISVVIPVYNEEKNILRCLESVNSQEIDRGDFEVIVIDNGSSDNTLTIVEETGALFRIEHQKGPAAARNAGVRKSKGEIIAFMDGDCVADKRWLTGIKESFKDKSIGCVAGEIEAALNEDYSELGEYLVNKQHLSQEINVKHSFLPFAATANVSYRRTVFEEVGFFDEQLLIGEDADMSWRMQLNSKLKLQYVPESIVYHPHESVLKHLFKQKRQHAYGSVMLFKKYKKYRKAEVKSLKQTYWEYRSIFTRGMKYLYGSLQNCMRSEKVAINPRDKYQLILEIASKVGLVQGSIRHRVWFV